MIDLKSRLFNVARVWVGAQEPAAPLSRLGKKVAGDANFFVRIESRDSTLQVATLEKFARFLIDPGNWPEGDVPLEVCRFAHAVGITGGACPLPTDIADEIIAVPEGPQGFRPILPADHPSGRTPVPLRSQEDAGTPAAPDAERGLPSPEGDGAAGDQSFAGAGPSTPGCAGGPPPHHKSMGRI